MDLLEVLSGSLDLQTVLSGAYALLAKLVPSDHGALCVSKPGRPAEYDWAVAEMPGEFFGNYAELLPHDFVRRSVLGAPNVVLRDSEMIDRRQLKGNFMYHRCRELGMPLEHVMAVMLAGAGDWHGGLTLYRSRDRPFSDRDRAVLQRLDPFLVSAVRNCKLLGETARKGAVLDQLLRQRGLQAIVFDLPATEVARTASAGEILERWFSGLELSPGGLPSCLLQELDRAAASRHLTAPLPEPWVRLGVGRDLRVSVLPLPEEGRTLWALVLEEIVHAAPVPKGWSELLTPRELEVASRVLLGWDNALVATEVGCSVGTVKKHLQHVFDKVGVPSRAALLHLALAPGEMSRPAGAPPSKIPV